jgi:DNA-binding MarR family transcriptional regulator
VAKDRTKDRAKDKTELAAVVWQHIFDFFIGTRSQRDRVLERHGLTPNDSRAMFSLDKDAGRTMRSLAEEWGCDPSNATVMIDRLVSRGLAERRDHPSDRRVKLVTLTSRGVKTRRALKEEMYRPPPELLALPPEDLELLFAAVEKLRAKSRPDGT